MNVNDDGGMMHGVDAQHMENDDGSPRPGGGAAGARGGKGKEAAYGDYGERSQPSEHGSSASGSQASFAPKEGFTYKVTPADRDAGGLLLDFFESVQRRASIGDEKDMCSPRNESPQEQPMPLVQSAPAKVPAQAHPAQAHPAQAHPAQAHHVQAHPAQAHKTQAHPHGTRSREPADAYPYAVVSSDGSAPPPVALALALGMAKEAADRIPMGPTHAHMGGGGGGHTIDRSTGRAVPAMSEAAAAAREAEMETRRGNTPSPTTTVGSTSTSGGNTPNSLEHLLSEGRGMERTVSQSQPFDDNDACSSRATSASSSEKGDGDSSDEAERREAAARGGADNIKFDLSNIKRSQRPGDAEDSHPVKKARSFDNLVISDSHRSISDNGLQARRTGESDDMDSLPPPPPPPPPPLSSHPAPMVLSDAAGGASAAL